MQDTVGVRLKQLREQQGLSLRRLARLAQLSASSLGAVERGVRAGEKLTIATGRKLARALGVTLDALAQPDEVSAAAHTVTEACPTAAALTPVPLGVPVPLVLARGIVALPGAPPAQEGARWLGPVCRQGHTAFGHPGHTHYLFFEGTWVCTSCRIAETVAQRGG